MPRPLRAPALSVSERVYRLLLFIYPPSYRREYHDLMAQTYRDLCRSSYRQGGMAGLVAVWFRVLADLATSAVEQHIAIWREGGYMMTKKEHALAVVAAALPLGLWLVLGLVNPRFVGRMFANSSAQPWGWIMSAAVLILAGMAYFLQRKAFDWSGSPGSPDGAIGRPVLREALRAGSMALFVLPAILLVVFGPAIMMVLEAGL